MPVYVGRDMKLDATAERCRTAKNAPAGAIQTHDPFQNMF